MKLLKIISLLALLISMFVTIDLGINCIGSLVPELQDGIPYNSVLQSTFGLLENSLTTRADFFNIFKTSVWISFAIFVENILLYIFSIINKK